MRPALAGLVPVRGFETGKTRLADELTAVERAAIMRWMMTGVVGAAIGSRVLGTLAVISPDPGVLAYARTLDERVVPILQREDEPGLNPAVTTGRDWAVGLGASGLLVLFADLPFLTSNDVRAIAAQPAQVVIATDRHGVGSNASLVRFTGKGRVFVYKYGADSARLHAGEAARLGLSVATIQTPGTAFDLDTPQDWRTLAAGSIEAMLDPDGSPRLRHAVDAAVGAGELG